MNVHHVMLFSRVPNNCLQIKTLNPPLSHFSCLEEKEKEKEERLKKKLKLYIKKPSAEKNLFEIGKT